MSISKGSRQKFTKRPTDIGSPTITAPQFTSPGFSWNGAADIDENNSEQFYFHIFGNVPSSIKLFIFGDKFNQIFYTELGQHNHGPGTYQSGNVNSGSTAHTHTTNIGHSHTLSGTAVSGGSHRHGIRIEVSADGWAVDIVGGSEAGSTYYYDLPDHPGYTIIAYDGTHSHTLSGSAVTYSGSPTSSSVNVNTHQHAVDSGSSANTGIVPSAGAVRTSGSPKEYFTGLKIWVDGVDKTAILLAQAGLASFGDGTAGHILVTNGVELSLNGMILTAGQHKITLSLTGLNNGGKVRYNLYVY